MNEIIWFYFVFELNYVKLSTESMSPEEKALKNRKNQLAKYLVIGFMILLHLPLAMISTSLSKYDNNRDYFKIILAALILLRIIDLIIYPYVYTMFAKLLHFFYQKKLGLIKKKFKQKGQEVKLTC